MWKKLKQNISDCYEMFLREFSLVSHDVGLILFFAFLPLVYPVIYSLIYNPELVRDVPMVVVDHDRSADSRDLVRRLDACQEAWVIGYASDLNEARHAVNSHDAYAILEIPEGFGRNIGIGEEANAVMYCEMSLLLRYRGFLVATTNVMMDMGADLLTKKVDEVAPLATTIVQGDLLPIENISLGNIRNGFDSFIMPGVLILILHQCIILASGMSGGAKRERPELSGLRLQGHSPSTLSSMIGQTLCYVTILILPAIYMLHYVPLMFKFPMMGNLLEEMVFILPMVLACIGMGFVFHGVVKERESVFVLWVVTSVVFLFLSGLTWPRYAMHGFWRALSDMVPATWGVEGFIKMNANGSTLAQVRGDYIILWIQAGVWMVLGYCVQRWVQRPAIRKSLREEEAKSQLSELGQTE